MSTGILLSYKGLGTNILHLSYCHQIAKVFGPVEVITLSHNFKDVVENDPLIKNVIYIEKYQKKLTDIYSLSKILKKYNFENIFIFYPSLRFYFAAKIAKIKNIFIYSFLKKKNLHLVKTAKKFVEKNLNIKNCPTETKLFIDNNEKKLAIQCLAKNKKNIIIGAGSSGPTTKWGTKNYINLIKKMLEKTKCYFLILAGPNEKGIAEEIINAIGNENAVSLAEKNIKEIIPIIANSDMYVGNDSFGQHVACQSEKPSFVLLFDTPSAYSEYSKNQYQIIPEGTSIDDITHDSAFDPNKIKVEMVLNKIFDYL